MSSYLRVNILGGKKPLAYITFRLVKFEYYVWEQMNKYIEVIFTELKFNIHVVLVFMDT